MCMKMYTRGIDNGKISKYRVIGRKKAEMCNYYNKIQNVLIQPYSYVLPTY